MKMCYCSLFCLLNISVLFFVSCGGNNEANNPLNPADTSKKTDTATVLDTVSLKSFQGYCFSKRLKIEADSLKSIRDVWMNTYSFNHTLGVGIYADSKSANIYKLKYFDSKPVLQSIKKSDIESWACFHERPDTTAGGYYIIQGRDGKFYQMRLDSIKETNYMPFDVYYFSWQTLKIE